MDEEKHVPYVIPVTDFNTLAAATTATTSPSITIGPYPFVWEELVIYSWGDTDDVDIDSIRDQGASINFLQDSVHINALRQGCNGTGNNNVWKLSKPYQFQKYSSIQIQVTNNDASLSAKIELAFHGYLIM